MSSVQEAGVALGCVVGLVTSACSSDPAPATRREIGTGLTLEGDAVRVVYGDGPGTAVEG